MGDLINLNKVRKERAKTDAKAKAAENKARWGLGKPAKTRLQIELEKARRDLDGARRDPPKA